MDLNLQLKLKNGKIDFKTQSNSILSTSIAFQIKDTNKIKVRCMGKNLPCK